jgi:hypothetical protein
MATSPCLWIIPKTGGFSSSRVPRPRFPRNLWRRPSRPSLATMSGRPLCPAVMYTSSTSVIPSNSTGFFYPQSLREVDWSSTEHRQRLNPTHVQSAHWINSIPSNTNRGPRFVKVDGGLQKRCHSNHQIGFCRSDIHTVDGWLDGHVTHVCLSSLLYNSDTVPHLANAVDEQLQNISYHLSSGRVEC